MSNLNFLFANAVVCDDAVIKLMDGKVNVYKRPRSSQWQCRFKLANNKWHNATTGTDDIEQAKIQAISIYHTAQIKINFGLALTMRTFKQIAIDELANMRRSINASTGKRAYRDYEFAINKYLIPFFGAYEIKDITPELISDFEAWRIAMMGKAPKGSTKLNHSSAYNRVINLARERGMVTASHIVPALNSKGARGAPRPAFNNEEVATMLSYLETWQKSSYTDHTLKMRILCGAYIQFLLHTGVRHGTEALRVRWQHLQWYWVGNKKYLRIWVSGKTGPRYLIARREVVAVLEHLIKWQKLEYKNLNTVIEARLDRLIFVLPDNSQLSHMENIFRNLMVRSHLRKDASGQNRTLYSLRHTYATQSLAKGVDIHTLAKQMGTSVGMIERHYSKLTPMLKADILG
jgi:integrase